MYISTICHISNSSASAKMLAIFNNCAGEVPRELTSPHSNTRTGRPCEEIIQHFVSSKDRAISIRFTDRAFIAHSAHSKNKIESILVPRCLASVEDIYCVFKGALDNLAEVRRQYGLSKTTAEAMAVIEAYTVLRDRAPYPADQVLKGFHGHFAFVLFDAKSSSVFAAADPERSVALYWGTAGDGSLVFSDDAGVMRDGCGKSYAPFPAGCMYWSSVGLRSFEHPLHKMKAMPRVDSEGHMCGANFKVDTTSKISPIPRVGSSANWALCS